MVSLVYFRSIHKGIESEPLERISAAARRLEVSTKELREHRVTGYLVELVNNEVSTKELRVGCSSTYIVNSSQKYPQRIREFYI